MPTGTVYLVGAGPGHPGLLTLRAAECLRRADVVIYDKLVPTSLLSFAPESAQRVCVMELGAEHPARVQPIHACMIASARSGKTVVRLKGGDPHIFGRGGEEAEVLRQADIPFEIVPGITAALAMAAFAGIPLTHRQHASAVAIVTGHEDPTKPDTALDWAALAAFPGTLVFYMGMSRLDKIVRALLEHGKDPATPAAVVQHAGTGSQRSVTATLDTLAETVKNAGLCAPALTIVGSVVRLRDRLNWFEHLPLFGQRILVPRPRHQAGELVDRLIELGAVPMVAPAVEIRPLEDYTQLDQAIQSLAEYHWLVFTSVNGVRAFMDRLRLLGRDLRALGRLQIAAIGPKTADAVRAYHLDPDLVPERFQSEDLAAALKERISQNQRVLLARADRGRDVLRDELSAWTHVDQVPVYSQVDSAEVDETVLQAMRRGEIDFVLATSSNIARSLARHWDETCRGRVLRGETRIVSISPITSEAIRSLGLPVGLEANEATTHSMVEAMIRLVAARKEP